jgi:N-acetylmuramoyl-L-alanine amidase
MVGDSSLYKLMKIDLYGIELYSRNDGKIPPSKPVEYSVRWSELQMYKDIMRNEDRSSAMLLMLDKGARNFSPAIQKQYSQPMPPQEVIFHPPQQPLLGMRIVIDPGHVANDTFLGHIEQKFIAMKVPGSVNDQKDSVPVAFAEGQLTWQTAIVLATRLRNAGAEVLLTRSGPGMTAFGKTFEQWKRDDYPRTLDSLLEVDPADQNLKDLKSGKMKMDRSIFRFVFKDAELRKRSEIINAFKPDLTVVIHYNVDETNAPWNKPSNKNFCMLFVPGSFEAGELSTPEDRFDFLRLLLLDDVEESIEVSNFVAEQFSAKLQVPLAGPADAGYLSASCRKTTRQGVFARNLSMTRLIHGPLVYGETLYQDNKFEARMLADMSVTDMPSKQTTSKRVLQVADAYFQGISNWWFTK